MKILLGIFCGAMALFAGGCTLMLGGVSGAGGFSLVPIGILVLNGLVLAALFGMSRPIRPVFYILAVADLLIAGGLLLAASLGLSASDAELWPWVGLIVAAFAAKGFLTWRYVRSVPRQTE